jgi:hypothetical protein
MRAIARMSHNPGKSPSRVVQNRGAAHNPGKSPSRVVQNRGAAQYQRPANISFFRDIDPTVMPIRSGQDAQTQELWWLPVELKFPKMSVTERINWCFDQSDIADAKSTVELQDANGEQWLSLYSFGHFSEKPVSDYEDRMLERSGFFRVSAILMSQHHLDDALKKCCGNRMTDPMELGRAELTDEGYLYEYPWREPWISAFESAEERYSRVLNGISFFSPTVQYHWESHLDLSLNNGASADLPSPFLADLLGLSIHEDDPARFVDQSGKDTFRCFRSSNNNITVAVVRKTPFLKALKKIDLSCVWVTAGEKLLFTHDGPGDQHAGRAYTSVGCYKDGVLETEGPWFEDTHSGISDVDPSRPDKFLDQ